MVAARRASGMSQQELADELGERLGKNVDATTVSRMETDRRGIDWRELRALRDIFAMPADWFLDGPTVANRTIPGSFNPGSVARPVAA